MKTLLRTTLVVLTIAGAQTVTPAIAADTPFSSDQLDALLVGNTVYLDVPAGGPMGDGGETPIRFGADGSTHARLPTGTAMVGAWHLDEARYCVDWNPAPTDSCTSVAREDGGLVFVDADTGVPRGTLLRIEPGDPEGFDD